MSVFTIQRVQETVRTIYQELFTIKFIHGGYENAQENFINQGLRVEPDSNTKQVFEDHKIDYRFYGNTLVCFIQCVLMNPPAPEPKVPSVSLPDNIRIRFLVTSSSDFAAKTFVVAAGSTKTYQFSNKTDHIEGGSASLTAPVEIHSITKDFETGTLVQDSGHLFTAVKDVSAADVIPISDTGFWKQLQAVEPVVNNADLQTNAHVEADTVGFAVIDLYKTGTTNDAYKFLDVNDQLFHPAPELVIRFKSRF